MNHDDDDIDDYEMSVADIVVPLTMILSRYMSVTMLNVYNINQDAIVDVHVQVDAPRAFPLKH